MDYKVLIKIYVPEIEEEYEMYIPINKYIGEITYQLCKVINDLSKIYPLKNNAYLCNRRTGIIYDNYMFLRDTDIRNGTELVIF